VRVCAAHRQNVHVHIVVRNCIYQQWILVQKWLKGLMKSSMTYRLVAVFTLLVLSFGLLRK
jgi:hypothetical protein